MTPEIRSVEAWKSKTSHTWFRVEESTYQLDFELMVQAGVDMTGP